MQLTHVCLAIIGHSVVIAGTRYMYSSLDRLPIWVLNPNGSTCDRDKL